MWILILVKNLIFANFVELLLLVLEIIGCMKEDIRDIKDQNKTWLTLTGMSSKNKKKCSSLAPPRSIFYKTQWAWLGVKLTRLRSIFTFKKVWKFLIKTQLTKSDPKRTSGWKVPSLMPIWIHQIKMWPCPKCG